MAIFGKPPTRRPESKSGERKPKREPKVMSARELAAHAAGRKGKTAALEPLGVTSMRGPSVIEWSTAPNSIEVAPPSAGLSAVLENAALLFANGQDVDARQALEQGVANDPETRLSPLAWLALFDLLQRAGDRAAFDQLAMQFVLQFERSAPSWEEPAKRTPAEAQGGGGYIAVTGKLSQGSAQQLEGLKRALEKGVPRARLDLASVSGFDDAGARLLASELARARGQRMELALQRPDKLRDALEEAVAKGREGGEGAWLLSLELMQWAHDHAAFDERAVDFAVAFEVSPPSWEPPPDSARRAPPDETRAEGEATHARAAAKDRDVVEFEGVLAGPTPSALARLADVSARHSSTQIDMRGVERIDFVCAGALLNAIGRIESQGKSVEIESISPIVRALLLLIGISPRHFVRKVD
ncbi:MAG TPA: STAS domain-containing protein [Casimicrobiaceae bacterium]|nr:STAS domain-containing protein [Casimicrobiaceae bacterium]